MLVEGELRGAETDVFGQFILGLGKVALDLCTPNSTSIIASL